MVIEQLFQEDINRKINGVVKVDQDATDVLVQELDEYVITRDLKKHFITFFNNYGESFHEGTADIGVWISGFFGSGKSHFLKMLSYLLANQEVQGVRTVERFRKKFEDDPATFMLIDSVTKGHTDTILFNIDIEGSINKDKTAVLRVFAKMFYNHLGFYGENLKVAKLEQFIEKRGMTAEFRRVFEEKNGGPWLESRDAFAFFEDDVVDTLKEVLGMSEDAARNWFNGTETVETSIAQLVSEMKDYVDNKTDDFRLLFMVDEVGQYVGGDTDLLINLQSLVEKIGSECGGKIWVVCTGQEAIDEIIKARENEFSRIQARFKTRLSLTSSSADEVIQKRILKKSLKWNRHWNGYIARMIPFFVICSALLMQCWTLRDTPARRILSETSRSYLTSSLSCRKYLLKSVNMVTPVSIFPVASVRCFQDSRKQHRRFRIRTSMHWHRSTCSTIPYIHSLTVLFVVLLSVARRQQITEMALSSRMWTY